MPLIKDNDRQMVVTHGNGPQVGNLLLQQLGSDSEKIQLCHWIQLEQ